MSKWGVGFIPSYAGSSYHQGKRYLTDIDPFLCDLSEEPFTIGGKPYVRSVDDTSHPLAPFLSAQGYPLDTDDTMDCRVTVFDKQEDAIERIKEVMSSWFKNTADFYKFE